MRAGMLVTGSSRKYFFASISLVALALAIAAFAVDLLAGVGAVAIGLVVLLLLKIVSELNSTVAGLESKITQSFDMTADQLGLTTDRVDALEGEALSQTNFNEAVLNRVRAVETATGKHERFNEALLGRVRAVETTTGEQEQFNEPVLNRVRDVETATGEQARFGESVLDRVRTVETATGRHERFNDALLDRVRALESRLPRERQAPPGQERRLLNARGLIDAAETTAAEAGFLAGSTPVGADRSTVAPEPRAATLVGASPTVSVIVTCFNEEMYVAEALESIRQQSFEDWECIVVDDASTDGTVAEIERVVTSDSRFRLLRHSVNSDVAAARNTGLQSARGRYITFHDADDLLMKDSLADRVDVIEETMDADVAGVFCGLRIADMDVRLDELPRYEEWKPSSRFWDFVSADGECPFGLNAVLLRISVVRAHGGFDEDMPEAEDWEFWLRLMRSGFYFVPSEFLTIAYRQKVASKSQTHAVAHVESSNALIHSAHSESDIATEMPASYPFPHPLSYYRDLLTRTRRAVQYAATALLRSDIEALDSIVATLEPGSWPVVRRHVNLEAKISDGFRRAAGLDVTDLAEIKDELEPLQTALLTAVRTATG